MAEPPRCMDCGDDFKTKPMILVDGTPYCVQCRDKNKSGNGTPMSQDETTVLGIESPLTIFGQ